jgi:Heavy metal associated domain 2
MKHVQIAHQMPGRVRFKIPMARDNPELLEQIRRTFADMPGLKQTSVKPDAGSIVLIYDPDETAAFEAQLMQHWAGAIPSMPRRSPKKRKLPGDEFDRVTRKIEAEAEFLAGHSHSARAIVDSSKTRTARSKS